MVFCLRSCRVAAILVFLFLFGATQLAHATFSLLFEGLAKTLNTGGSITLSSPYGIAVDSAGDVFIADTGNSQIVKVNAQGVASVLTISGLSPALVAPAGITVDGSGNLYIADISANRVVKISPSGAGSVISTGSVVLSSPQGVALDQAGDIFIADTFNNRIVEVSSGGSAAALTINVSPSQASLSSPTGLAVDVSGNLYIVDSGNSRIVTVAAGSTTGVVVSFGSLSPLSNPSSVAVDRIGNIYVGDTGNNRIAEVDTAGNGFNLLNSLYLRGTTLSVPVGVAIDIFGAVYIADTSDNRVVVVNPLLNGDPDTGVNYSSSLNKTAVGFGHITLGSSIPTSLVLNFDVGFPVSGLSAVNVFTSGTPGLDFQIVSGPNTTCSSSTELGTPCTVEVSFLPTAPGLRNGALVLYDPALNPVLTVPLYGFGDAPVAVLAPNTGTVVSTGGVPLNLPVQIVLDGAGNIYAANGGGNVVKIPAGGGTASVVSPSGLTFGTAVTGVAILPSQIILYSAGPYRG